jgi:AAA+ superfamily predicted ATPase
MRNQLSFPAGKTMVARILGKLLNMVGILPTDKVVEVQRTDLVGEFVGHTGPRTRKKVCRSYDLLNCPLQVSVIYQSILLLTSSAVSDSRSGRWNSLHR